MKKVLSVEAVDVWLNKSHPPVLVVHYKGTVPTTGWTAPELLPWAYINPPEDGIYDFDLVATPPSGPSGEALSPVEDTVKYPDPPITLKGVRVHAVQNYKQALISDPPSNAPEVGTIRLCGDGIVPWL